MKALSFRLLLLLCSCATSWAAVDLAITVSGTQGPVSISSNLIYSILVTNKGTDRATGVVVTNQVDQYADFVAGTTSQGICSQSGGVVSCDLGNLEPQATANITLRFQPKSQGGNNRFFGVLSSQPDSDPYNNLAMHPTLLGLADVAMFGTRTPVSVVSGQIVTYVLTVTNVGPDPTAEPLGVNLQLPEVVAGNDVIVSTNLSVGTFERWAPYGPHSYRWRSPVLLKGQSVTLRLQIQMVVGGQFFAMTENTVYHDPSYWNHTFSDLVTVTSGPGVFEFAEASQEVSESLGHAHIRVLRRGGATGAVQVSFSTADGTATSGDDYTSVNQVLAFASGETQKTVAVSLFQHPQLECPRQFKAQLFNVAAGGFLGQKTNSTITIVDDDVLPRGTTECISVSYSNSFLAAYGYPTFFSDDGRFILFNTPGQNWLTNGGPENQIFLRDTTIGSTRLISVNHDNTEASLGFFDPSFAVLSGNAGYVAFGSDAMNLVTNSVSGTGDLYLRDVFEGTTQLISVTPDGVSGGDNFSDWPMISSNGMVIVFASAATNLVANVVYPEASQLYVRNLSAGITQPVSTGVNGLANRDVIPADMTPDGRFVVFSTDADNLAPGDSNGEADVFVRDLLTQSTLLVSVAVSSANAGNGSSYPRGSPRITPNGRFVVFDSEASDLVPNDTNGTRDVFIRDLTLGTTRLVSVNRFGTAAGNGFSAGTSVTPDGRYVAFLSDATDLVAATYKRSNNVFVRDLQNNTTTLASANCSGIGVGLCTLPTISKNGRHVAFLSFARDLVSGEFLPAFAGAPIPNIYRYDLLSGDTILVSANYQYTDGANRDLGGPAMSADGRSFVFSANATHLSMVEDVNDTSDVFLWRELPSGLNADVRVTSTINSLPSVMIISLHVTNFGPATATGVVVQDTLSGDAAFIAADTTLGLCNVTPGSVTCSLGTLTRRAGAVIRLIATPTANGEAEHAARVLHDINDPLLPNNSRSDSGNLALPNPATLRIGHCHPRTFVQWLSTPAQFQLESGLLNGWSPVSTGILDNSVVKTLIVDDGPPAAQFYRLHRP